MKRTTTAPTAAGGRRWLSCLLAAVLFVQLAGAWTQQQGHAAQSVAAAGSLSLSPSSSPYATKFSRPQAQRISSLVDGACSHAIVPLNPSCPRQLIVNYLGSAGFGHQFTELLFGMYASQYLGLTLTWSPFAPSQDHGDDYTGLVKSLGLERFFVEGLGLARSDDLRQLRHQNASTFGQWIETQNSDKRFLEMSCNNSVLAIEGWWHCRAGVAENNCFWAPEHEYLFQRFGACLRAGVQAHGTAFDDRCVLVVKKENDNEHTRYLPHDTLVVVWHLRFGDVAPRKPDDAFFANVVQALKEIVPTVGLIKRVRIVLVGGGGGKGTGGVAQAYVDSLRAIAVGNGDNDDDDTMSLPKFSVERFHNDSFEEQFLAMMQADVLIGSGSSVPQVAALLSSGRPLFFNHVSKHGYGYGQEATADSVDMDENGRVLDSLRRVKVMLFDRLVSSSSSSSRGRGEGPCRRGEA